ncbi:uncharacterized protein [Rutidosis leptorrhynchoides]|uniref:uncharacterized protein n=1 Tax=Rutidosis leptorrhynchoides TaxID=125765 RepID=UPI003A99F71A
MAYIRRQGFENDSSSFEEFVIPANPNSRSMNLVDDSLLKSSASDTSSLAAKAIRASSSSANRDSALSSAYDQPSDSSTDVNAYSLRSSNSGTNKDDSVKDDYISIKNLEKRNRGFWGVLARKARSIIEDDDDVIQQYETPEKRRQQMYESEKRGQLSCLFDPFEIEHNPPTHSILAGCQLPESLQKSDNRGFQKGLGAIASSLNYIGGTIGNALEEGKTIVENRTADIIHETRKLHMKTKSASSDVENAKQLQQTHTQTQAQHQTQTDVAIQLKASRDVSMAMAAKAKVLLRELKTVKADLAFAKERCAQLEDENRVLREGGGKGGNPEDDDDDDDDDLIRLQLESLLAEKARLAQENSVYSRENRFLREIVEYHQLTMQDVVYFNEISEEVSQNPLFIKNLQSASLSRDAVRKMGYISNLQSASLRGTLIAKY